MLHNGQYFQHIIEDVFHFYNFDVKPEFRIGNFIADFIAENKNNKYLAEVKYSNSGFISTNIIDKAVDRLISCTKQDDEKIIPVLIVNGIASEELKNTKDLLVIDIANILYLLKDNNNLKNQLLSILEFSIDGIMPSSEKIEEIFNKPKTIDKYTEEDSVKKLIKELEQWKPIKNNWKKYEDLCREIVDYLFNERLLFKGEQKKSNDGLYRFDSIYKIKDNQTKDLWNTITRYFNSKYIVFEFKNYKSQITQKDVYTTEKYLYLKALRGVAIIISCKGTDGHAIKAIKGILRENGKLILSISNNDLIAMLNKKIKGESPTDYLEDILDDLLIELEK